MMEQSPDISESLFCAGSTVRARPFSLGFRSASAGLASCTTASASNSEEEADSDSLVDNVLSRRSSLSTCERNMD